MEVDVIAAASNAAAATIISNGDDMVIMDETANTDEDSVIKNKQNMCRVCGRQETNAKFLFDTANGDLIERLQTTFSSCIIIRDEMLPQHLCASCELTVNTIYCKISNFYKFEQQLMADLKSANPSHPYLRAIEIVQNSKNKVESAIDEILPERRHRPAGFPLDHNISGSSSLLKELLLKSRIFQAKSLQQICLDFFNQVGPTLLGTVLKDCGSATNHFGDEDADDDHSTPMFDEDDDDDGDGDESQETNSCDRISTASTVNDVKIKIKKKRLNPVRHYINKRRRRKRGVGGVNVAGVTATAAPAKPTVSNKSIVKMQSEIKRLTSTSPDSITAETTIASATARYSMRSSKLRTTSSALPFSPTTTISVSSPSQPAEPTRRSSLRRTSTINAAAVIVPAAAAATVPVEELPKKRRSTLRKETAAAIVETTAAKPIFEEEKLSIIVTKVLDKCKTTDVVAGLVPAAVEETKIDAKFKKPVKRKIRSNKGFIRNIISKRKRAKARINYSEALVDEALMYEEMLMDKEANEQRVMATTIEKSRKNIPQKKLPEQMHAQKPELSISPVASSSSSSSSIKSTAAATVAAENEKTSNEKPNEPQDRKKVENANISSSEISIYQVNKKAAETIGTTAARKNAVGTNNKISLSDLKKTFKSNPDVVYNINSSVSIQLKSPTTTTAASSTQSTAAATAEPMTISPVRTATPQLPSKILKDENTILGPVNCHLCGRKCTSIGHLAVHQLKHIQLQTHRVGEPQLLDPKLRRGRMVPIGQQKCFRCLNCWQLHPNSQSILDHWVTAKCLHYCSICGESFHNNPKEIRTHFMGVHGILYKLNEDDEAVIARIIKRSSVGGPLPQSSSTTTSHPMKNPNMAPKKIIPKMQQQQQQPLPTKANLPQKSFSTSVQIIKDSRTGRVTCHICSCSFPNMQSRNSHMRLHKAQYDKNVAKKKAADSAAVVNKQQLKDEITVPKKVTARRNNSIAVSGGGGLPANIQQRYHRLSIDAKSLFRAANVVGSPNKPAPKQQQQQLRQLLQQGPKEFHFNGGAQLPIRRIEPKQRPAAEQNAIKSLENLLGADAFNHSSGSFTAVNIKAEIDIDEQMYHGGSAVDAGEYDDYGTHSYHQPEVVYGEKPTSTIVENAFCTSIVKSELTSGGPRIQLKKLTELQELPTSSSSSSYPINETSQSSSQIQPPPAAAVPSSSSTSYYTTNPIVASNPMPMMIVHQPSYEMCSQQPVQQQQQQHHQLHHAHHPSMMTQQMHSLGGQMVHHHHQQQQQQQQPVHQLQISQVQQLQNAQYYNPVFLVQPQSDIQSPPPPQPPPQLSLPPQPEMYHHQYNDQYSDYNAYYS